MSFEKRFGEDGVWVSVVIATYNRQDLLRRLLEQLDDQTISHARYEVIAVDDGSKEDTRAVLADVKTRYAHRIERQQNSGPAVARQRGVDLARGKIVVFLDDDMQVKPTFLEAHLRQHAGGSDANAVVLGRLRPDAKIAEMPLFERFYARVLRQQGDDFASGKEKVRGHNLYTGNVSMPRALFVEVGGFDPQFRALEDEELGIRLEKGGASFGFADEAESVHGSDWTSMQKWMERAKRDGVFQTKVSRKHPDKPDSSPWRHLPNLNPISRPFMGLALSSPNAAGLIANAAIRTASAFDKVGLEPVAIAGCTFVYGLQYYRGVREETGSAADVAREYAEFKRGMKMLSKGAGGADASAWRDFVHAVKEDHRMVSFHAGKYDARDSARQFQERGSLGADAVKKIGFQIMVAYRVMRFLRASGLGLGAQFMSRLIRHAYASDIHWEADFEPGITVVHGFGLAISYAARVRHGCILFQNVTLGYGPDPETKEPSANKRGVGGAPLLEKNVHVGIGATLYGPITVGEGTKIMAGCVVSRSIPARSIVEAPMPQTSPRVTPRAVKGV